MTGSFSSRNTPSPRTMTYIMNSKRKRPHRPVDLEPDRVVDKHDARQFLHALVEQRVADDIAIGRRLAEIGAEIEGGDERRQHKSRQQGGDKQAGENAQRPLGHKTQRVGGVLKALRDQKPADRKEDEHAV